MATRLQDPTLGPVAVNTLRHYAQAGMLTAKSYANADDLQIMATAPRPGELRRSIFGDAEEELLYPFTIDKQRMFGSDSAPDRASVGMYRTGALIGVRVLWASLRTAKHQSEFEDGHPPPPEISVDVLDSEQFSLVTGGAMYLTRSPAAKDVHSDYMALPVQNVVDADGAATQPATQPATAATTNPSQLQSQFVWVYMPPNQAGFLFQQPKIFIHIMGESHNVQYWADPSSVIMAIARAAPRDMYAPPLPADWMPAAEDQIHPTAVRTGNPPHRVSAAAFGAAATNWSASLKRKIIRRWRYSTLGSAALAGAQISDSIPLEIRSGVERGGDVQEESTAPTDLSLTVRAADGLLSGRWTWNWSRIWRLMARFRLRPPERAISTFSCAATARHTFWY